MAIAPLSGQPAPLWQPVTENVITAEQQAAQAAAVAPPTVPGPKVTVISPKDGKAYDIDQADVARAQAQGYKLESTEGKAIREYVQENSGLSGAAKVALHGFLDQATFGVYGAVDERGQDPLEKAKAEALKQDHAVANILGQAGGFAASMFYGGEFFKGAQAAGKVAEGAVLGERILGAQVAAKLVQSGVPAAEAASAGAGLARKLLASGAKFGAEGAVFAAPKAVTELALGDPERAAETMMFGLGGGALLGLAGGAASSVGKAMAGSMAGVRLPGSGGPGLAAKVREWGDDQAISALGLAKKYSTKLNDRKMFGDAAKVFRESGVGELAGDAEAIAAKFSEMREATGQKIGAIYKAADEAGAASRTSLEELVGAMRTVTSEKGLAEAGKVGAKESVDAWISKELVGPIEREFGQALLPGEEGAKAALSLEQAHKIRQVVDRATKWDKAAPDAVNELKMEIRSRLSDLMSSKLDAAGGQMGRELRAELGPLNREYGVLSILSDNAENNVGRFAANQSPSLTDKIGGAAGAAVGGMIGGLPGSIVGAGVGTLVNNQLRRKAPAALSGAAHGLADWMERRGMAGALEANAQAANQLARVPDILGALADGAKKPSVDTLPVHALTMYAEQLGVSKDKPADMGGTKSGHDSFTRVASALTDLTANPEKMAAAVKKLTEPFEAGAPNVAAQLAIKAPAAMAHLQETMPKPPVAGGLLAPKPAWKPTDAQVAEWGRRWNVVQNPFTVFDRLADRSLTRAEVDTLKAVYPKLHETMLARVMDYASTPQAKPLSYRDRDRLSLLMGVPLDGTNYGAIQGTYQQSAQPPQPKVGPVKPPQVGTDAQRLTYK